MNNNNNNSKECKVYKFVKLSPIFLDKFNSLFK